MIVVPNRLNNYSSVTNLA